MSKSISSATELTWLSLHRGNIDIAINQRASTQGATPPSGRARCRGPGLWRLAVRLLSCRTAHVGRSDGASIRSDSTVRWKAELAGHQSYLTPKNRRTDPGADS